MSKSEQERFARPANCKKCGFQSTVGNLTAAGICPADACKYREIAELKRKLAELEPGAKARAEFPKLVRCVNATPSGCGLEKGKVYTASEEIMGRYYLVDDRCWQKSRFEDVKIDINEPSLEQLPKNPKPFTYQEWKKLQSRFGAVPTETEPKDAWAGGLSGDAAARKATPLFSGLLAYFPNACAYVGFVSKRSNEQHNPGEPMHWDASKSTDEADALMRHQAEAGSVDSDGIRHSGKVAWRAFAQLERELLAAHPQLKPGVNVKNFKR